MFIAILVLTSACSQKDTATDTKSEDEGGKTKVEFWHAMSGDLEEVLNEIVKEFNVSQNDIEVVAEYQGSYEEGIMKFRSVAGTKNAPALMQTFEIGTKYMIDSDAITPVQEWIDKDNYDVSQLEENILSYYKVDGKLYSMPFNSSTPVFFYNKDAFKEAGLDPDHPPETLEEVKETAEKLTIKKGNDVERYGFSMLLYGWFFEELLANQGGHYVDNENGRKGEASKATFNDDHGLRIFKWLDEMNKAQTLGNFGSNWDDIRAAFLSEKVAMYMDSSAATKTIIDEAPFEVGVGFIPYAEEKGFNGVVIGGASIWMTNSISEEEQKAAFEFMKYLQTPEIQAKWHVNTGYFAVNPQAYEEDIVKKEHTKYPALKVPIEQLQKTKPSTATQGALITVFPESRQHVVTAIENVYQGMDPKQALDKAAEETNRAIETSAKANK